MFYGNSRKQATERRDPIQEFADRIIQALPARLRQPLCPG
jgi:hypothetical protein